MKKALLALSLILLSATGAFAQSVAGNLVPGYNSVGASNCSTTVCFRPGNAVSIGGYFQFTVAASTALPSIPAGAFEALIICETQTVRWRDDGVAPTASIGMPLTVNTAFPYMGTAASLAAFRIIETAASATCNVSYYK